MNLPEIIAHRGASHAAPENTSSAVRLAWAEGADAVEADFRLTADGHIVAIHDETTGRVAGLDHVVAETTLAELKRLDVGRWKDACFAGERLATLAELLSTVPDGRRFLAEIKCGDEIVPQLARCLIESGKSAEQLVVISYNTDVLRGTKRLLPEVCTYLVAKFEQAKGRWTPTADDLVERAEQYSLDGLVLKAQAPIDAEFVHRVKAAGLTLCTWTVDEFPLARRLIQAGVDGIITSRPADLRAELTSC